MRALLGREAERDQITGLLDRARAGSSGVLMLRGEGGIGKSALLEDARLLARARGFRTVSVTGIDTESGFAFAGLHQICTPLARRTGSLPQPQQQALGVALGDRAGPPPDHFLVGLATLNLLADTAENRPLLCIIDDAQWLDEASAKILAFVARRLLAERLVLLFAVRTTAQHEPDLMHGLPEVQVGGLEDADARQLVRSSLQIPLDEGVLDVIVGEAHGNPLALLELPLGVEPAALAGGFGLPHVPDVAGRVEASFRRRTNSLPATTQLLLLLAAAESTGSSALLWEAADRLGIGPDSAGPAEAEGLITIRSTVRFRHPLARSTIYTAAPPDQRRRVHAELAAATDGDLDPDRRAWHRARAVWGTDEEVAAELERSAGRAHGRGGVAASAAFLEQAADLTPDPGKRAGRALEAAHHKHEAGASVVALGLLATAEAGPLSPADHLRAQLLRAHISFHRTRGDRVPRLLLDAAQRLATTDPQRSRETYLEAIEAATTLGDVRGWQGLQEIARAARQAPPPPTEPRPVDLLLDGMVAVHTRGFAAAVPALRAGARAVLDDADPDDRWLLRASITAGGVFEDQLVHDLVDLAVRRAREAGALARLPAALLHLSITLLHYGRPSQAAQAAAEGTSIAQAIGAAPLPQAELMLAAWRGHEEEVDRLVATTSGRADAPVRAGVLLDWARALLGNGQGNYAEALAAARRAATAHEIVDRNLALLELVESASRVGDDVGARSASDELRARAEAAGTEWARGLAALCLALTSAEPEPHYREALERLASSRATIHRARAGLLYGEWLRRAGRRQDARLALRTAYDLLTATGGDGFAARAARELKAAGEHPRPRTSYPTDALTPQELHIARLVATGATSREVATQLFLSPRTIEAHLRAVFRKLDLTSRRQLRTFDLSAG